MNDRARADGADSLSQMMGEMDASRGDVPQAISQDFVKVHQSETTLILRCANRGMKVLVNVNDSQDKVQSILEHERRVSNYLPPNCAHRKVHGLDTYRGCNGFNFDWVEGITLKAWLQQQDLQKGDFVTPLHVAIAILEAVASFHDAGVAHANITPDNIILIFESGQYSATLIDLSKAKILADEYPASNGDDSLASAEKFKINDLKALGSVLFSVFGGEDKSVQAAENEGDGAEQDDRETDQSRLKKRRNEKQPFTNNMPLYLISLLSALSPSLNVGGDFKYQYHSASDVLNDLKEAAKKPDLFLTPFVSSNTDYMSVQIPKDSFYGRLSEVSMVKQSLDVVKKCGGRPVVVAVSGFAGAGKTALLKQIAKPIVDSNGFVITCNFNKTVPSDTVLASAFNKFFGACLQCDTNSDISKSIRSSIRDTLHEHINVLEESMPNLRSFMEGNLNGNPSSHISADDSDHVVTDGLTQRWKFLLSKLLFAVSKESHPIAIIFEDIHCISPNISEDRNTLDTLQKIMLDHSIQYCSYYISYRDSDAEIMDNINQLIECIQVQGHSQFYSIRVGPIAKEAVNTLVSESLRMPPILSQPLSSLIHSKTGGIILFITQFIKSLQEIGLIRFCFLSCKWEFDLSAISQLEMSDDIVQHLVERILRLPKPVQLGLQIAACLGPIFDAKTFEMADSNSGLHVADFLYIATGSGFIQPQDSNPGHYAWAHDRIREAAYSLIPRELLESLHMLVGVKIYTKMETEKIKDNIHLICRNMNMGLRCLDAEANHLKAELAHLNLIAGSKSAESSAFHSSANYFVIGLGLLGRDWHITNYKLGMDMYNAAAEALFVTGNAELFKSTIEQPITHARTLEDRLPASFILVRFLASSGDIEQAIARIFSILRELGEHFPTEITPQTIHMELIKTKQVLSKYSKKDFTSLPKLEEPIRLWAMMFMQTGCRIAFFAKTELILLIACRIVHMSVEHGWCNTSAFGLCTFGHGLISVTREIDDGHFWVKKGLELLRTTHKSTELSIEMKMYYHVFMAFWFEPFQASREVLIDNSHDALMSGQVEFAMYSAFNSCRMSFMCGQNLVKGETNCMSLGNRMSQLRQIQSSFSLATHHSMILTLTSAPDTTRPFTMLDGDFHNEDDLLEFCLKTSKMGIVHAIYSNKLFLAYFFRRYDEAAAMAEQYRSRKLMRFLDVYVEFFEGLSALQLAQRRDNHEQKWIQTAERAISSFKTWENHCSWNYENKLLLLEAEMLRAKGQVGSAEEKYKTSIASAQKHRFDHEAGMAMELAGEFYKEQGRNLDAKTQFIGARDCYERWGATALVKQLNDRENIDQRL